jgi:hypothetical protein
MMAQAVHPRPAHRIADIFRLHRKALAETHVLSLDQRRLSGSIAVCRTSALGGYLYHCPTCETEHPVYCSCCKRGCPNCQELEQEKWIAARAERILPIRHFHVVFTLPSELRRLARSHPADVYNAFFRALGEILAELARDHYGIQLGWTAVLHTWKRNLGYHPHMHVLVTAGGLLLDGSVFLPVCETYLFSGEVMGQMLRGKMLDALRGLLLKDAFPELDDAAFDALMTGLAAHKSWVIHIEAPFRDASHLLGYLGRYVYRIAISDSRLVDVTPEKVTFKTKDGKTKTLHPVEFLHRFLQHVLPQGFHKVRHGGLYASTRKGGRLDQARALILQEIDPLEAKTPKAKTAETLEELAFEGHRCPVCNEIMVKTSVSLPRLRAPPGGTNA